MDKGLPTAQCPNCGAFERLGTEICFACGTRMDGVSPGSGFAPLAEGPAAYRPGPPPPEGPYRYGPPDQGYGGYGTGYGYPPSAPPAYGYPAAYGYQPQRPDKGATTALVLGIVAFFICGVLLGPFAMIEGFKSRKRIRESNGLLTGDGMALAGVILGAVALGLNIVVIILEIVLITASSPSYR
ncbi:MAG: DUF4190 domain-containing protein [Actinobacteria bacterium]|nr:DUF4190 domain-containing protein [Actinomycetota bacterium]